MTARARKILEGDLLRRDPPKAAALAKIRTMSQMVPREYAGAWHHMSRQLDDPTSRAELTTTLKQLREAKESSPLTP